MPKESALAPLVRGPLRRLHPTVVTVAAAAVGVAAAVAAARLLRLDAAHMAQSIALSATSMGGLMAAANTSVAREYHAGLAAMLGVHAALAAQRWTAISARWP